MPGTIDNLKPKPFDQAIVAEIRQRHGDRVAHLSDGDLYAAYQDWLLAQGEGTASETFLEWLE